MIRIIFLYIFISTLLFSKSDFYYSFVNDDLSQISKDQRKNILEASNGINTIKRFMRDGEFDIALKQIEIFRKNNKLDMFDSEAILLNSQILYQIGNKTRAVEGDALLESAVNSSKINQDDLLEAYKLLVLFKIRINKAKEAEYYAKAIEYTFDDPSSKVYGKIAFAQIYIKKREYRKAIKILTKELIDSTNLDVATIVADDLYDAYILNKQIDKARELVEKVLEKNIDYYANDSYKALVKVNKLIDAKMDNFAIDILLRLIEKSNSTDSIDNFKFILANIYMNLAGFEPAYLKKAKIIYRDLIKVKDENNKYLKRAKMYLDEIIMREGKFDPQMISAKYSGSDPMQYKAMMQELINSIDDEKYEQVVRMKKVYSNIPQNIINRFGYESLEKIYEDVNAKMLRFYLNSNQCQYLYSVIKTVDEGSMIKLISEKNTLDKLFGCMIELPEERTYNIAKNIYNKTKNSKVVFYLEQVALLLRKYDQAYEYSIKLDSIYKLSITPKDKQVNSNILSDEFLYRFLVYGHKNSAYSMETFFTYALKNQEFIINNQNKPMIIDFYYQYYLFLLKHNEQNQAINILYKLYEKQKKMHARVYSPFVEIELAKYAKLDDNYDKALEYLEDGLSLSRLLDGKVVERKIKKDDLAQIYYEMAKIYEYQKKENRYKTMIKKCQNLKDVDSYYKKMCDKM